MPSLVTRGATHLVEALWLARARDGRIKLSSQSTVWKTTYIPTMSLSISCAHEELFIWDCQTSPVKLKRYVEKVRMRKVPTRNVRIHPSQNRQYNPKDLVLLFKIRGGVDGECLHSVLCLFCLCFSFPFQILLHFPSAGCVAKSRQLRSANVMATDLFMEQNFKTLKITFLCSWISLEHTNTCNSMNCFAAFSILK